MHMHKDEHMDKTNQFGHISTFPATLQEKTLNYI